METAKFSKVSYQQFEEAMLDDFDFSKEEIKAIYEDLKLPKRATKGSAGYDFYTPIHILLKTWRNIKSSNWYSLRNEFKMGIDDLSKKWIGI